MLLTFLGSCLYNLYGPQGNFSTPNYPQNYGHNVHCTWLITTSPGSYIFLRFDHFHLEGSHGSCPYDYVRIYDGNSYQSLTMRRCDYQDSWCIYSHSNVLYVHFQTDGSVSYPGFTAYYEKVSKRYTVCKVNSSKATFSHIYPHVWWWPFQKLCKAIPIDTHAGKTERKTGRQQTDRQTDRQFALTKGKRLKRQL